MNIRPLIGFSLLHHPLLFRGYATKSSSVALFPSIPSSPSSFFSSSTLNSRFPLSSFSSPVNVRYYRPSPYPPRSTAPQPSINPPPSNQQKLRERPAPSTTPIPSSSAIIDPSTSTSSVIINKDEKTTTTSGASLGEEVETLGASKFLRQVYTTTGIGIGGSFAMAYTLSLIAPVASMAVPLAIGGAVVSIASIISMSFSKYTVKQSPEGHYYSEQSLGRKAAYAGLSIGNALLLAPIFQIAPMISPALLPLATILSLSTMGAASLFAYSRPAASLSVLRTTLVSTLAGFVAMGLISLGSTLIIGPNIFSSVWHSVDTYGGILLFSAFTAYDTYMAVERYRQRDPDHIMTATQFFLDFMNLFIRFVEIFGKDRK